MTHFRLPYLLPRVPYRAVLIRKAVSVVLSGYLFRYGSYGEKVGTPLALYLLQEFWIISILCQIFSFLFLLSFFQTFLLLSISLPALKNALCNFPTRKPTNRRTSKPTFGRFLFFFCIFLANEQLSCFGRGEKFSVRPCWDQKAIPNAENTESVRFFESPLEHVSGFS